MNGQTDELKCYCICMKKSNLFLLGICSVDACRYANVLSHKLCCACIECIKVNCRLNWVSVCAPSFFYVLALWVAFYVSISVVDLYGILSCHLYTALSFSLYFAVSLSSPLWLFPSEIFAIFVSSDLSGLFHSTSEGAVQVYNVRIMLEMFILAKPYDLTKQMLFRVARSVSFKIICWIAYVIIDNSRICIQ